MNIHLVNFYKTWLHWAVHENASNPVEFWPARGLCDGLQHYCRWLGLDEQTCNNIFDEMLSQFRAHQLRTAIPFDEGISDYVNNRDKRKNPLRLQWCIDRIKEAESHA